MRRSYAVVCIIAALMCVLLGMIALVFPRAEHRVISATLTLFSDYPCVVKIHECGRDKQSVVNANVTIELVQSRNPFATYTVDVIADRWCKRGEIKRKENSNKFGMDVDSIPLSLVSGTFGPRSQTKLSLTILENLDLTELDFCIVIRDDYSRANSLADASKAHVVVRYDVKGDMPQIFSRWSASNNQSTALTISFLIGFAGVLLAFAHTSRSHFLANMKLIKMKLLITDISKVKLNRCRFWVCSRRDRENPGSKLDNSGSIQDSQSLHHKSADALPDQTGSDSVPPGFAPIGNCCHKCSVDTEAVPAPELEKMISYKPKEYAACGEERYQPPAYDSNRSSEESQESLNSNVGGNVPLQPKDEDDTTHDSLEDEGYLVI